MLSNDAFEAKRDGTGSVPGDDDEVHTLGDISISGESEHESDHTDKTVPE